ncbi:hypothetical protein DMUE_5283 [Dictyocoela muelleri]|nr:hypothetical protein DMUE_5283 [Dictyocoela muelleri]
MDILKYHENLVKNIFISLANLNEHPLANLNHLIRRHFFDYPIFLHGNSTPFKAFELCNQKYNFINLDFDKIIQNIISLQNIRTNMDIFYSIGKFFIDKLDFKVKNFPHDKLFDRIIIFKDREILSKISNNDVFMLIIREKVKRSYNMLYILFSGNQGIFYASDLPFLTPLHQLIIQNITRSIICELQSKIK